MKIEGSFPPDVEERIKRIEDGLLPPILVKGEPSQPMKLADRMQYHKTPGLSLAFINDERIEWTRGYGCAKRESRSR